MGIAAALAAASTHPLSRAISTSFAGAVPVLADVREIAGNGVEATIDGHHWQLGSPAWSGATADGPQGSVWLTRDRQFLGSFSFEDSVRPEAAAAVAELEKLGLPVRLLSGDAEAPVRSAAREAGIVAARFALTPEDKLADVSQGRTLMVGDGINDTLALRAAYASMAPSSAADIGRTGSPGDGDRLASTASWGML